MWSATGLTRRNDEPTPHLDACARRSLSILCIVYLLLAVPYLAVFLATDLPLLLGGASDAATALSEAVAQGSATAVIDQATDDAARAASAARRGWFRAGALVAVILVLLYYLLVQRRRVSTRQEAVAATTLMVVLIGALLVASRLVLQTAMPERSLPLWGLADILALHLLACLIIPWYPSETVPPFILLLLVWAATFIIPHAPNPEMQLLDRLVAVIISPVILIPGLAISGWRMRRLREDAERLMLDEQVRSIGGELSRARIVHDAMFPKPFDTGYIRFEYDYRPIAEIGGDYVHVHVAPISGHIYLTVLDVAGHGLAAALTVNRLFGELERIRAEDPDAEPAQVMELLNRYIHLTMAPHSLYATATCIQLDPSSGEVRWVNAGHPPSMLRSAAGDLRELPGTTMLLGAQSFAEFEPNQQTTKMGTGDVLIAYTDGAFEARNSSGQPFGLPNLRKTAQFNPPPRNWARFIANAVSKHHGGHADDDVLVASLHLRSLFIGELHHETGHTDVPSEAEIGRARAGGRRTANV